MRRQAMPLPMIFRGVAHRAYAVYPYRAAETEWPTMDAVFRTSLWIVVVSGASILFSLALACATPFAAMAAVAGTFLALRPAVALVVFAWLVNQAVGYLVLGYPTTWDSFAWGGAIGIAALAGLAAVIGLGSRIGNAATVLLAGFLAAFAAYELVLFAFTAVLPSGDGVFSFAVVLLIFWTNVVAIGLLLALHVAAVAAGFLSPTASVRRFA